MTARLRKLLFLYTLLLSTVFLALPAGAVTLEEAARALKPNVRVYDFARVLSDTQLRSLNEQLKQLEKERLAEAAVVVLDQLEGQDIYSFARDLGEQWKIGGKESQNGLLVVVSIKDRKRYIVSGVGIQKYLPDAELDRIETEHMVPAFRREQYGAGLESTVTAISDRLHAVAVPAEPEERKTSSGLAWLTFLLGGLALFATSRAWPRGSEPGRDPWKLPTLFLGAGALASAVLAIPQAGVGILGLGLIPAGLALLRLLEGSWIPLPLDRISGLTNNVSGLYWGIAGAVALAWVFLAPSGWLVGFLILAIPGGLLLPGYFRRMPRRCPQCQGALRWLKEEEEAQFLKPDENAEQSLGSVDYDVWRCNNCNRSAVTSRAQAMSTAKSCPKCGRRTLTQRTVVDEGATHWGNASAEQITECQNPLCDYRDTQRRHWGGGGGGHYDDGPGLPGMIILPPIFGGWGGGHHGGGGGNWGGDGGGDWGSGGVDVGGFGGGGDFDGGGAGGDW